MNPNTGEILVMANLPNYDPANYSTVTDASLFMNQITEVPYEPASVCKSFAFSAAINEGVMSADTTYFNQGYEIVDDWKIQNAEQRASLYGTLDMKTALYWSPSSCSLENFFRFAMNSSTVPSIEKSGGKIEFTERIKANPHWEFVGIYLNA